MRTTKVSDNIMLNKSFFLATLLAASQITFSHPLAAMENIPDLPKQQRPGLMELTKEKADKQILAWMAIDKRTEDLFGKDNFPMDIQRTILGYHFTLSKIFTFSYPTIAEIYTQGFKTRLGETSTNLELYIKEIQELSDAYNIVAHYFKNRTEIEVLNDPFCCTSAEITAKLKLTQTQLADSEELERTDISPAVDAIGSLMESVWNTIEPKVKELGSLALQFKDQLKKGGFILSEAKTIEVISFVDRCFTKQYLGSRHWGRYRWDLSSVVPQVTNKGDIVFTGNIPCGPKKTYFHVTKALFDTWPNPQGVEQIEYHYIDDQYKEFFLTIDFPAMGIDQETIHITTDTALWAKESTPQSYTPQGERQRTLRNIETPFQWRVKKAPTLVELKEEPSLEESASDDLDPETSDLIIEQYTQLSTEKELSEDEKYSQIIEMIGTNKETITTVLKRHHHEMCSIKTLGSH